MDVVIVKRDLLRLVQRCQGIADKKSTMPLLGNVLLTANADTLRASATDTYLSVTGTFPAEIKQPGTIAIPAKDLFERVKAMPEGPIQISSKEGSQAILKATSSPRRYTLHGMPGADFPALPSLQADAPKLTLPAEVLSLLLQRTHFSISGDETRPHVNSALLECVPGTVRMVTTDGHRLSKMEVSVPESKATATMLLPLKAITELRRLTDEARAERTGDISIAQQGPDAFFSVAGVLFSVKLVDAQFPPYQQVIPAQTDRVVRAPRTALADALRAVALAASDRTGGVKVAVSNGVLRITSESPESGNGFDEVGVDYQGADLTFGIHARYFLDVLSAIDEEEILLGISGELDPAVLRPGMETSASSYVAVVMPMRI